MQNRMQNPESDARSGEAWLQEERQNSSRNLLARAVRLIQQVMHERTGAPVETRYEEGNEIVISVDMPGSTEALKATVKKGQLTLRCKPGTGNQALLDAVGSDLKQKLASIFQ